MAEGGSWLPEPRARRAGYLVHTQTIYPEATAGVEDVGVNDQSPIMLQTTEVLERLRQILAECSSDLASVVRCEVLLSFPADFYEFNLVWRRHFPDNPPARWVLGVGDTHPVPGARVAIHAIAVSGDSGRQRELLRTTETPDSLSAEHCAQAVRVGDYLFPSPVAAIEDYGQGVIPPRNPLEPPAAFQARVVMERYRQLLESAGTSLAHTIKSQNVMTDLDDWVHINHIWGEVMQPPAPPRTSVSVSSLVVPNARMLPNLTVLIPNDRNRKEMVTAGVPFAVTEHGYNYTAAIQTADYLSLAGHLAYDYSTFERQGANPAMPHLQSDIEVQVDSVLEDRMGIVQANELEPSAVCEAKVYLRSPRRDLRGFRRAWKRWFPGDSGPVVQVIPVTGIHFRGTLVEIELLATRKD